MLENIGTYNLYALLGKFYMEENIIIHNVNQGVDIYLGKLQGPIPLGNKRSLQAFELRARNRNIIIQTFEKRSIIVIESIIMGSEKKRKEYDEEDCEVLKAIREHKGYGFDPKDTLNLPSEIVFVAVQGCYNEVKMQEHLTEITIMGYQGNILLSTIITPRTFVTINPKHLGFDEEELLDGKDEFNVLHEIRHMLLGKTIVSYDIKNPKTM